MGTYLKSVWYETHAWHRQPMDVSVRTDEMFPPEPIVVSGIKNLLALVLKDDWVNGYCLKCCLVVSCKEEQEQGGRM